MDNELFAFNYKTIKHLKKLIKDKKSLQEKNLYILRLKKLKVKNKKTFFLNKNYGKYIRIKFVDYILYSFGFIILALFLKTNAVDIKSISLSATILTLSKFCFFYPFIYIYKLTQIKRKVYFEKNETWGQKFDFAFDEVALLKNDNLSFAVFKSNGNFIPKAIVFFADSKERVSLLTKFFINYTKENNIKLDNQL